MADPMPPEDATAYASGTAAATLAAAWLNRLLRLDGDEVAVTAVPATAALSTAETGATVAELALQLLQRGQTLTVVVPDDELPPAISGALSPSLRPLCLMLPAADFAVGIVVRSTLSLLRNALARDADAGHESIWSRQQQRVANHATHWQQCLAWSDGGDSRAAWPPALADFFPVRIVAEKRISDLAASRADFALIVAPATGSDVRARRRLLLSMPSGRPVPYAGDDSLLRAQLAVLSHELGHMEMELATVRAELGEFAGRYQARVGVLMARLDALEAERATPAPLRAATGPEPAAKFADARQSGQSASQAGESPVSPEPASFRSSSSLKQLYRQVAQRIHPDRAADEADRTRRTALMVEANQAYRAGDEAALQALLGRWRAIEPKTESTTAEIRMQLDGVKRRLGEIEAELHRIFASRLYEMFVAARLAQRRGRDLLDEMAADLELRIAAAESNLR